MPSKVFGPTDSVADTLTQIGSDYYMPPGPGQWFIYAARVAKGVVVNATNPNGFLVVETTHSSYFFAYGGGCGGATNSDAGPAEVIEMCVPVPANSKLVVRVLDAVVAKDVTVSVQFASTNYSVIGNKQGNPEMKTLAAGGVTGSGDSAADTEESMTTNTKLTRATMTPEKSGKIYQIRFSGSGIVDAKAASAKIALYIPGQAGPYEFAVGNGAAGATLGGVNIADVINLPDGIPVATNAAVDVKITSAEAMKYPHFSATYW